MLNRIQVIGRVGQEPEVRHMQSGEAVCNFSVATTERWKDKATGTAKEETTWHRVTAYGRLAEIIGEYLRKGTLIYVEGKAVTRRYTNKDGVEKVSHEIRANDMKMLSGKEDSGSRAVNHEQPNTAAQQGKPVPADELDDLPF